jgi:8-oxo-dGTP pyrophosphatase MutT (NUDIX family)
MHTIRNHSKKGGAGCLILTKQNGKWVALLGCEKYGGKNKGKLNIAAGGRNVEDNDCFINCAIRELKEEFKIDLTMCEFLNYFSDKNTKKIFVHIIGGTTPVFIGVLPNIDLLKLNQQIDFDNKYATDECLTEMEFVDFVDLDSKKQITDLYPKTRITSFANSVINTANKSYNFL